MPSAHCCQESWLLGLHVVGTGCGTVRAVPGASGTATGTFQYQHPCTGPLQCPIHPLGLGSSWHTPDLAVPDSAHP